jgi:hypothetical protein
MNDAISKLQRYDLIGCDSDIHIGPESCGDYVKYADVQAALLSAGKGNNTHKHTVAILAEKWDEKTVTSAPFCIVCGESAAKGGE